MLVKGDGRGCVATQVRDRRMERQRRSLRIARPEGELPNNKKSKRKIGSKISPKTTKIGSKSAKNQTKNALKNPRKTIKTQKEKTKNESSKKSKTDLKTEKNSTKNRRKINLKIETNPTKTNKKSAKTHLKTSPKISKIPTHNQSKSTLNFSEINKKTVRGGTRYIIRCRQKFFVGIGENFRKPLDKSTTLQYNTTKNL